MSTERTRSVADILFGDAVASNTVTASNDVAAARAADSGDDTDDTDDTDTDTEEDDGSDTDEETSSGDAVTATTVQRPRTPAEILYGGNATAPPGLGPEQYLGTRLDDNVAKLADHLGWSLEQQQAEKRSVADFLLNELQLENHQAHLLLDVMTDVVVAGSSDERTEQNYRWLVQAHRELRERHGATGAEAIDRELKAYAKAHPRLEAVLTNGGAHPKVVAMLAEHVRRVGRGAV